MKNIRGYIYADHLPHSARHQFNLLRRAMWDHGARTPLILEDTPEDRRRVREKNLIPGLKAEDLLIIASEAIVGDASPDRRKFLTAMSAKGVMIQVGLGEPVLYDTDEKIDKFLELATLELREINTPSAPKKRGGGPYKHPQPSPEQKSEICLLWNKKDVPGSSVLKISSELLGYEVKRWQLQEWCGRARFKNIDN